MHDADLPWPPVVGDLLPGADDAAGIREKLTAYCLNLDHEIGAPKARGFIRILGITPADVEYLVAAIQKGIREAPVANVRDSAPFGVLCEVRIEVAGLRERRSREAVVVTSWELRRAADAPRLVTAYID